MSDLGLLMSRMNAARHCGCMGRPCRHRRLEKVPGASLESHLEQVEIFLDGRLAEVPDNCLRFNHNEALFFLLTLWGDPLWRYRVNGLHPGERAFMVAGDCCLCKWQPMHFDLNELVDYLIDISPYDEPPNPDSGDANPSPPVEGDTDEEGDPMGEEDPEEDPMEEEDPEEYPEEDPEEYPEEESQRDEEGNHLVQDEHSSHSEEERMRLG